MVISERTSRELSVQEKNALESLLLACRGKEPITLSIPEDGDGFLLAWDGECAEPEGGCPGRQKDLLACLVYCRACEDEWECYAFTRPDRRRQGIFGCLLEYLCRIAGEQGESRGKEISLFFLSDGKSPDGLAAADAVSMEYWYSEYQMELKLKDWAGCFPGSGGLLALEQERIEESFGEGEGFGECQAFNSPYGACRLLPYGGLRYYLYHMEIWERFRGKGWGKKLLASVLSKLPPNSQVILQVSSWNRPAVELYRKTGFRITETLSYYRFVTRG